MKKKITKDINVLMFKQIRPTIANTIRNMHAIWVDLGGGT